MNIESMDHIVLTVRSIEKTSRFYINVPGMDVNTFGAGRKALLFGAQKITLHELGNEFQMFIEGQQEIEKSKMT